MKSLIIILLFAGLSLTGCYTVLWTPDQDLPTESSYYGGGSGYSDGYYSDPYYGGYGYYYESPWWLTMSPPTRYRSEDTKTIEKTTRSEEIRTMRINDSGRNEDAPRLNPPTRSSGSTTGSTDSSNQTTNTSTETRRNDNSNSGSNSSDNRNQSRNSGERNSGNGRR